ncbi:family 43 glycosylhydrolase [Nocardioides sp. CN2-186]|uniref:family 43 glycosylhydrolase n=1 Tax=Nocardioides tweenelious TaxID=3156607 RepID=UPI0032B35A3C
MQRGKWGVLALVVVAACGLVAAPAQASARPSVTLRIAPVFHTRGFADPTVVPYAHGYLAVGTGWKAPRAVARTPRGPWHQVRPALTDLPRWVRSPQIWAADLNHVGHRWVLYYAAVAHGAHRRCIGVATARRPVDQFRPVGRHPLICPEHGGVIDPSAFVGRHHHRYLVYKTQGNPATIRLVRLAHDGRHKHHRHQHHRHKHHRHHRVARSHLLLRSRTTIENPQLVRHGKQLVLFASEGYFGNCGYHTTWRRSRHLFDWRHSRPHGMLHRRGTRICGPGGADVVRGPRQHQIIYFHGWSCGGRPCPAYFLMDRGRRPTAHRVLYAAHLRWHHGKPRVRAFRR